MLASTQSRHGFSGCTDPLELPPVLVPESDPELELEPPSLLLLLLDVESEGSSFSQTPASMHLLVTHSANRNSLSASETVSPSSHSKKHVRSGSGSLDTASSPAQSTTHWIASRQVTSGSPVLVLPIPEVDVVLTKVVAPTPEVVLRAMA